MAAVNLVPGQRKKFTYTPFELTLLASIQGMPPNNVYWVQSTATGATDTATAGTKEQPFATIDYAVGRCTANKGDVILALPGHVETISGAASLAVDVAGISVIGLGQGKNRPILDFTNTAGTVTLAAANILLANMIVRANVSAITMGLDVNADDVELAQLGFTYDATGDDFAIMVDCTSVDNTYIHDCVFDTELSTAGGVKAINLVDTDNTRIEDNVFRGQWSASVILVATTLCRQLCIKRNLIYNTGTAVYGAIDTGTLSTTGIVARNDIVSLYATAVAKLMRDGDLNSMGNYWANAVSVRGAQALPATSAS